MFQLSETDCQLLRDEIGRLQDEGEGAVANSWLVWAELYLNTIYEKASATERAKKVLPLAMWLARDCGVDPITVQDYLKESILKILFQSKLEDRELSAKDGHKAIEMFRSKFKKKAEGTYD